jgi:hypothetical protein
MTMPAMQPECREDRHNACWGGDALLALTTLETALGGALAVPRHWRIARGGERITTHPAQLRAHRSWTAFEWRCDAALTPNRRGFMREQAAMIEARGGRVFRRTALGAPTPAAVIDFDIGGDDGLLHGRHIASAFDDGRVICSLCCLDHAAHADATEFAASRLWRLAALAPPPVPPGWRRFINERAGVQFAAPEDWRVDHASESLHVLRRPGAARMHPTLVLQSDFSTQRLRRASDAAAGLSGLSTDTDIGNRPGIAVLMSGSHAQVNGDLLHLYVPEPTERASHLLQLYAAPGDGALVQKLFATFRWIGGI